MTLKGNLDLKLEPDKKTIQQKDTQNTSERFIVVFDDQKDKYKKRANTSPERRRRLRQLVVKKLVKLRINNGNPFYDTLRKVFTLRVARR